MKVMVTTSAAGASASAAEALAASSVVGAVATGAQAAMTPAVADRLANRKNSLRDTFRLDIVPHLSFM